MPETILNTLRLQFAQQLDKISIKNAFLLKREFKNCQRLFSTKMSLSEKGNEKRSDTLNEKKLEKIKRLQHKFEKAKQQCLQKEAIQSARFSQNKIKFDDSLPVVERKAEIMDLIQNHQVVIVAGETGSGKTTQLPKMCLELGLGKRGLIGHTQPRRIAARAVAHRIAEELDSSLGDLVGYKVRFNEQVQAHSFIKLMTDGILLSELQQDKLLLSYDTIIIDEAHERSLNIDFILGYLKQILPKRPDLKVIITSATIDVERFSVHFDHAPIIEVSGRTYPVQVRYRPTLEHQSENEFQPILDAVDELFSEGATDILVFLTGEKEIRDVAQALSQHQSSQRSLMHCEIVPLYARLSQQEQNRIFQAHVGRRIVLSTNVAETSLTIPNIDCVIDTGFARISRYSARTKVQRLPIEPISQASANQRKGRCGRVSDGICIRLYSEEDFNQRPFFTDPEIVRTNLASVILKMQFLNLGDIRLFPFIDPPEFKLINDGLLLLKELKAIELKDNQEKLTPIGLLMAQLPVDPRLARMLIEANRNRCLTEMIIITAALAIQDPREYPLEKQQAARERHGQYKDRHSDFLTLLNLWHFLEEQKEAMSVNQLKQFCRKNFLNYLRLREWQDVQLQITQLIEQLHFKPNEQAADYQTIHQALLSGLLSSIGNKELEGFQFLGARNTKFTLFPTSALFKHPPKWIIVNELIETTKLWGNIAAKIEPEWIEPLATHLIKKSYSDPHWSKKAGSVQAKEKVMLYGLTIVQDRAVNFSSIDPVLSRELFIQEALIAGDWQSDLSFFKANQKTMANLIELEHKTRRQDILANEQTLFDLYDHLLPNHVCSSVTCKTWWKSLAEVEQKAFFFTETQLTDPSSKPVNVNDFPDEWIYNHLKLKIQYHFDINQKRDGVTIDVPLIVLNQIESSDCFTWQVSGFRHELVVAYIKSLPKHLRRHFVPAPNYATAFLESQNTSHQNDISLQAALTQFCLKVSGIKIEPESWQLELIPDFLKITFRIIDEEQKTIAQGKDLEAIKTQLEHQLTQSLSQIATKQKNPIEKENVTQWDFGTLPKVYEQKANQYQIKLYPALMDKKSSVAIQFVETEQAQTEAMQSGLRRLLFLALPSPIQYLHAKLPNRAKLALYFTSFGKVDVLIDDCIECALDYLIAQNGGIPFNQADYEYLLQKIKPEINECVCGIALQVEKIAVLYHSVQKRLKSTKISLSEARSFADMNAQLKHLIYVGFITQTGYQKLPDLVRYLQAMEKRFEKIGSPQERVNLQTIEQAMEAFKALQSKAEALKLTQADMTQIRWMVEELRVNLFAQQIKTPYPISLKRILQQIQSLQQS